MRKDFVGVDSTIVANSNGHRINEGDATATPFPCMEIAAQRKQCTRHEFHEPVVANQVMKPFSYAKFLISNSCYLHFTEVVVGYLFYWPGSSLLLPSFLVYRVGYCPYEELMVCYV